MKLISFAVPCYNSESYMHRCIDSLLVGGERVEIIIVNDGSSDKTAEIANEYAEKYPSIVQVIHKENGGHGSGIMAGLNAASGLYYKVVDSDDWADKNSLLNILDLIESCYNNQNLIDLIICNYVYEHERDNSTHTIHYHRIFPIHKQFTWDECGPFDITRYMIMHSVFYRTDLVRKSNLQIPLHTFYVDNVFLYTPLPYVRSMYYTDEDFYRYYIGRSDQSVNEAVMIKRVDQQILISKLLLQTHDLAEIKKKSKKLFEFMQSYSSVMVTIATLLLTLDGSDEAIEKLMNYWKDLKEQFPFVYNHLRYRSLAGFFAYKNKFIRKISVFGYRVVRKFYKFN